jgi:cysteine-rich repeat protein
MERVANCLVRTSMMLLTVAVLAGCDLMLGLGGKQDPLPFQDGDTIDAVLDGDMEPDGEPDIPPTCGNGTTDEGEECDDGNDVDGDGCDRDCTWSCLGQAECDDLEPCNGSEACEMSSHTCMDGLPLVVGTVCLEDPRSVCLEEQCRASVCGDGFIDAGAGEFCDPPGDGCTSECTVECVGDPDCPDDGDPCNGDEYCDPTVHACARRDPLEDGTPCGPEVERICIGQACVVGTCGDRFVNGLAGEECDDGNASSGDGCSSDCQIEAGPGCGDGAQDCDEDEACDDGNSVSGDGCSPSCMFEPVGATCANGAVEPLEKCDDANLANGDGCNPTCNFENNATLFAGSPGTSGLADGIGTSALLGGAGDLDLCGDLIYYADTQNNVIRSINISTGSVSTLAGDAVSGTDGYVDAPSGLDARFSSPNSLTTDGQTLWVADVGNHRLRAIDLTSPAAPVTTVAGSGVAGHVDGLGTLAQFDDARGLTYYDGYVYLLDASAATLRRFDPVSTEVVTLAGSAYVPGGNDGVGLAARFVSPRNMTSNHAGLLYLSDTNGAKIRVFNVATYLVTTFAGNGTAGYVDGAGSAVRINRPRGLTCDGTSIYWTESNSHTVRQGIVSTVEVSTMIGSIDNFGYSNGVGTEALFNMPYDVVFHFPSLSLFILDASNYVIRRVQ